MSQVELDMIQILADIKTDIRETKSDIKSIYEKLNILPCSVNTYKITLLQRVIYGGIGIILFAFMVGLIDNMKPLNAKTIKTKMAMAEGIKNNETAN